MTLATFAPSAYQKRIFNWIEDAHPTRLHGVVNAVAGSGKTTTLVMAAHRVYEPALFVAFNKHIVEELTRRLVGTQMVAKTMHSIGMNAVQRHLGKRLNVQERKYDDLIKAELQPLLGRDWKQLREAMTFTGKLIDLVRLSLIDANDRDAVMALIDHHDLALPRHPDDTRGDGGRITKICLDLLPDLLATGERLADRSGVIDFTDMVYLPWKWQLVPQQFAWVFVDECQDLNAAQFDLARKCIRADGRSLFVGDPRQAIYGFAGADADSFNNIVTGMDAELLPLSICYRCPTSHVDMAREIVPGIEARPDAPAGIIDYIPETQVHEHVQPGDYVLSRCTAPLISLCIALIKQRVPAYVKGRDIGKKLTDIVQAVTGIPGYRYDDFGEYLSTHEMLMRAKIAQREHPEAALQQLDDQISAVRVCYESFHAVDAVDLAHQIDDLFKDLTRAVTLCTVHRAKGLEGDRIFILVPDKLPLVWPNQKDWQFDQEMNLRYVALTRAKQALYFINPAPKAEPEPENTPAPQSCLTIAEVDDKKPGAVTIPIDEAVNITDTDDILERRSATAEWIASGAAKTPRKIRKAPQPKATTATARKPRKSPKA